MDPLRSLSWRLLANFGSTVALLATGALVVGLLEGGFAGALSGLVGALGTGSGVAILLGAPGTGPGDGEPPNPSQRLGGALAAMFCALGALHGGWALGWAWGLGGYVLGMAASVVLLPVFGIFATRRFHAAQEQALGPLPSAEAAEAVPLVSLDEFMVRTAGGRPNQMNMGIYEGHGFQCACGGVHDYREGQIDVLRELPGMRLVFVCPEKGAITCVKVQGVLRFRGFQSLFGARD